MLLIHNRYSSILTMLFLLCCAKSVAQVEFSSSNLPIINIETAGREILDDPRITANMQIIDNASGRNNLSDRPEAYDGRISIEIRGSTSQAFPKKQYAFETQNSDGSNNNVPLLGLSKENDWVLSAPFSDKTLIRNALAYKLSENLGHYAPRTRFCELLLNGEYQGVYLLTEKIKRDKNRVNISKLKPYETSGDDVSGGYIIKIDKSTGSSCFGWHSAFSNIYFQNEYPGCDDIVPEQKSYIINYVNSLERALFSESFTDSINGYTQFLDVNAAIDYFIVNELAKNIDAYRLSTFLHKDKGSKNGKLTFGPVWDFNIAFGNSSYSGAYLTSGLIAKENIWWNRFLEDSNFTSALSKRWRKIREHEISNIAILTLIDSMTSQLAEAQERNFKKWDIIAKRTWPNYYIGSSYEDEIGFLKAWIINRLNWLDNNLPGQSKEFFSASNYSASVFPNPFDYFFTYSFGLDEAGLISLHIFDPNGIKLASIIDNAPYEKGEHSIVWNSFVNEKRIPSSFYILVLEMNNRIIAREKIIKKY